MAGAYRLPTHGGLRALLPGITWDQARMTALRPGLFEALLAAARQLCLWVAWLHFRQRTNWRPSVTWWLHLAARCLLAVLLRQL
jgi:hypothetical protein